MGNAKVLDIVARGIFNMLGIDPQSMKQQQALEASRQARQQPIDAQGQTRTTNAKGNTRDFRSAAQSANRAPSLDPVQTRSNATATPPRRPANGFGSSRGQLSIFGSNPGAQVGNPDPVRAPSIDPMRTNIPKGGRNPYRAASRATSLSGRGGFAPLPAMPGLGGQLLRIGGRTLGGAGLVLDGLNTIDSLSQSLQRGEGYAAIPGLIRQMVSGNAQKNQQATQDVQQQQSAESTQQSPMGFFNQGSDSDFLDVPQAQAQATQAQTAYSGMADMSGDPIYPTAGQNAAPAAPVLPPAPAPSQNRQSLSTGGQRATAAPAPSAPRVKSEREIVNEAYDALRVQMNNGLITPEEFRRQGLAMHRKFFKKDKPTREPQMTGEGIRR